MEFSNALIDAISLAARAHQGQVDKAGEPYLRHVLRVGFSLLPDEKAAIVGILHDVIEDAPQFADEMLDCFDIAVNFRVRRLTRKVGEAYGDYIERTRFGDPIVRKVKLADLYDNLNPDRLARAAANGADVARLVAKYTRALRVLTGMHTPGHIDCPACADLRDEILRREKVVQFPQQPLQ